MTKWTDEQQLAIDKDNNNIIVSAGAGSGKTAVLTERVITKLKKGISLKNLVILTFTNLAASEMKNRISDGIRDELEKYPNLKDELDNIDQAIITTFDSYALFLVKKYSSILNIDKNISITDSIVLNVKLDEIVNRIFDEKYEEQDEKFLKLINDYTVKDDVKLRNAIKDFYKSINNMYNKEKYLNSYIDVYYNEQKIDEDIKYYINLLILEIDNIKKCLHKLSAISKEEKEIDYKQKLDDFLNDLVTLKKYSDIKECVEKKEKFPQIFKNARKEISSIKDEIKKSLDKLKNLTVHENESIIKLQILDTKEYVEEIVELLKEVFKRMQLFKKDNNLYEFIDIATLGINLLKENEDIRLEIKNSINEIMIDEYQDTNDIQDAFISLIANNNVYMVGDVKQSIYGFRNANPKIFMKKYESYAKGIDGIKIDLINNFRSRSEVLNNINTIFDSIMDEEIGGAAYKQSHRLKFGFDAYNNFNNEDYNITIYNYENVKKKIETEIFIIARDIKDKISNQYKVYDKDLKTIRNVTYSDFAILINKSTHFDIYKKVFEYMQIPLCVHKNDSFIHSDEMYTILNILRLIYSYTNKSYSNTYFKHSLLSVLRSFLFSYNDDEITKLMLSEDILEELKKEDSIFNSVYITTKNISDNLENMTLDEVVGRIYEEFNIKQQVSKLGNYNNIIIKLDFLKNKSKELSEIGYTLIDLINYIESVIDDEDKDIEFKTNDVESNSVSIMTIHASKGLEYNICYFPENYNEFSKKDVQKQFIHNNKYGLVIPHVKDYFIEDTIYMDLIKDDYKKEEVSERLRLFYVALTRARQKIILLINDFYDENNYIDDLVPYEERIKYNSFRDVILSVQNKLKDYVLDVKDTTIDDKYKDLVSIKTIKKDNSNKIEYINIDLDSKKIDESSFSKKVHTLIDSDTKKSMDYGLLSHKHLELMDLEDSKIKDEFLNTISEIGIDLNNSKKYNEYEFMYNNNGEVKHGIIDLLIETNDKMYIIDYKLKNIDSPEYINQLEGYKKYIEYKTNKEVECYLYSIMETTLKKVL